MRPGTIIVQVAAITLGLGILAWIPFVTNDYEKSVAISVLEYGILATAWALFSGPTRYISLATVAFFGIGAYCVAVLADILPWPVILIVAGALGGLLALLTGLATLRLSGIYFVIFTFGLAELIRQLVIWFEVNITGSVGRYIFLDLTQNQIYWELAVLLVVVFATGILIRRSRLGFALRVIGDDETVATHAGINTTLVRVSLFTLSSVFMSLTGAIMAPRWTYIDPSIAFNSTVSFQVLIMALLGGLDRLWGPIAGVVPMVLLMEFIQAHFPNQFSIPLGVVFLLIVYVIPGGVASLVGRAQKSFPPFVHKVPQ